jgi:hypothetical protein
VYLWLHISAINLDVIVWTYRYYIVDILNTLNDGLTLIDVDCVLGWVDSYFIYSKGASSNRHKGLLKTDVIISDDRL